MKYFLVSVLFMIFSSGYAQSFSNAHQIIFRKDNGNSIRAFHLPLKMICYFENGRKQQLILENVSNDSLIFRKYYNQENFDCSINAVARIKVNSSQKLITNTEFITSVAATVGFTTLTLMVFVTPNIGEGALMVFYTIPCTLVSSVCVIVNADALPFCFDTKKWKLHVQ